MIFIKEIHKKLGYREIIIERIDNGKIYNPLANKRIFYSNKEFRDYFKKGDRCMFCHDTIRISHDCRYFKANKSVFEIIKETIKHNWFKFKKSAFVNHLSFLWHPKNFFLCLKYPFWKATNVWDKSFLGYSFTWYEAIPKGWRKAFGKELSKDIKLAGKATRKRLHKHIKWKDLINWEQIKEKYGELCLYASASEEIQKILEKYECKSIGYCFICGKPARYKTRDWIEFYCEDCFDAYLDKLPENLRLIEIDRCRLDKRDIPEWFTYQNNKQVKIDLDKEYGIDYNKLWDIKE